MAGVLCSNNCQTKLHTRRHSCRRKPTRLLKNKQPLRCYCLTVPRTRTQRQRQRRVVKSKRQGVTYKCQALGLIAAEPQSGGFFDAAINSLVGGSAMLCFALSFVPLLTYKEDTEGVEQIEPDELEAVKWTVASIVSCLPYLNWTSWLLLAFDNDIPLPYYFISALYLIPTLRHGFDLNTFPSFMLVLGILHTQVERVAQTEPAILGSMLDERPSALESLSHQLRTLVSNLYTYSEQQPQKTTTISDMVQRKLKEQEGELKDAEDIAKIEQDNWDRQFDDKD